MSDATPGNAPAAGQAPAEGDGLQLGPGNDVAFADLMAALAPEEGAQAAGEGAATAAPPAGGEGQSAAPAEGAGAAGTAAPAPAGGDAGSGAVADGAAGSAAPAPGTSVGGDATTAGTGDAGSAATPGVGTVDPASIAPKWGEILTGLETSQTAGFEADALKEVQTEYSRYFEAVQQPPRMLIGQEVPSATGEGMETLRDAEDVRTWQEAVKFQLAREVRDRASRKSDDVRPMMETLHNSVALFQNNVDLIPGTKTFDKELADEFVKTVAPYELRVDGKLQGYNIPVQPLIDNIRTRLQASRSASQSAAGGAGQAPAQNAAEPSAQQQRAAEQARTAAGQFAPPAPQAGIPSKAGSSSDNPDDGFQSGLWGTLGLPDSFRV